MPAPDSAPTEARWLTRALRAGGVITDSEVTSVIPTSVGGDRAFFGALHRLELEYSRHGDGPRSLVVKTIEPGTGFGGSDTREIRFYAELAASHSLPIPRCFHAEIDQDTGSAVLLLEDLTSLHAVDFITGATLGRAEDAVSTLAEIHATFWNDHRFQRLDWLFTLDDLEFSTLWERYPDRIRDLLPGVALPKSFMHVGDLIADQQPRLLDRLDTPPITCRHHDIHSDNLLFRSEMGSPRAVVIDWQFVGRGKAAGDTGYLLTSSLMIDVRRQWETHLIDRYRERLVHAGVSDYSLDDCRVDYELSALSKLAMTVAATVMLDNSTPYRRAWRATDLDRLIAFIDDHQPHRLLHSPKRG